MTLHYIKPISYKYICFNFNQKENTYFTGLFILPNFIFLKYLIHIFIFIIFYMLDTYICYLLFLSLLLS